jgi:hypothetical protein
MPRKGDTMISQETGITYVYWGHRIGWKPKPVAGHLDSIDELPPPGVEGPLLRTRPIVPSGRGEREFDTFIERSLTRGDRD